MRMDVAYLVSDDNAEGSQSAGVYDERKRAEREVFVAIASVGMKETYEARSNGFKPEIKFTLALAEDYEGERALKYNGALYKIIRTYVKGDGIELTCQRWTDDL